MEDDDDQEDDDIWPAGVTNQSGRLAGWLASNHAGQLQTI